jgi:hypothetical protein
MTKKPEARPGSLRALPDGPAKRTVALEIIAARRKGFEATGNAIYAWAAMAHAEDGGVPVPEWVRAFFADAARRIDAGDLDGAALMLGLRRQGGTATASAWTSERHRQIAELVAWEMRRHGSTAHKAATVVAAETGEGSRTVRRAYDAWRDFINT